MPIYHRFVEQALSMKPRHVLMITPSRWFSGGLGLDDFPRADAQRQTTRGRSSTTRYSRCFPGVEIKGGVSYFLWARDHKGECEVVNA